MCGVRFGPCLIQQKRENPVSLGGFCTFAVIWKVWGGSNEGHANTNQFGCVWRDVHIRC
jgi:hypothetical protein